MLVRDFMHKSITSVHETSTLRRVIRMMKLHRMSAVPVVDIQGDYIGCITAHDILTASIPEYMKLIENTSFMANLDQVTSHLESILDEKATLFIDKKCVSINPNDTMSYAADMLHRNQRFILPVVEGKKQIGWITKIDIISIPLSKEETDPEIS